MDIDSPWGGRWTDRSYAHLESVLTNTTDVPSKSKSDDAQESDPSSTKDDTATGMPYLEGSTY